MAIKNLLIKEAYCAWCRRWCPLNCDGTNTVCSHGPGRDTFFCKGSGEEAPLLKKWNRERMTNYK